MAEQSPNADSPVSADDLEEAVRLAVAALRVGTDDDRRRPAGQLTWDCWRTAEHIASDLVAYAGQLGARAQTRYVPFDMCADRDADPAGLLTVIQATGADVGGDRAHDTLEVPGARVRPDIVFTRQRLAVFIDGCFWHRCPEHGNLPRANTPTGRRSLSATWPATSGLTARFRVLAGLFCGYGSISSQRRRSCALSPPSAAHPSDAIHAT